MDIIIVGIGKIGKKLAKVLSEENHNITVVDINEEKVERTVEMYDVKGVSGSGTHCDDLLEADVRTCDLLISVTPMDENNILTCLIARRMGAKNTIARVRNPEYISQVNFMRDELGISMMINPDFQAALELFRMLQFPSVMNVESFANGRIDMAEIKIKDESPLCDTKLSNLSPKLSKNMLICAVCRDDEVYIPNGDFVIRKGDSVYVTGSHKELGRIVKDLSGIRKSNSIKNVMLIGGSRISIYLAKLLISSGKDVVIIEKDKIKCRNILEHCPKATVVLADANNQDVLIEEGIESVDAVATLTGADETNFLVSMFSESLGVEHGITKINNNSLVKILKKIEGYSYINVSEVTCDIITQYVRAKKGVNSSYMKTLYKLVDGKIEAIEFLAEDYVKFLGKPLSSVKIKNNTLIAAVNRKNRIFVPGGNDTIEKGDTVIVVSKDYAMYNLNDILA